MVKNVYEKGNVYISDVDGFDAINTHMPFETYISCDDVDIYKHINYEDLDDLLEEIGANIGECIFMLKTVVIEKKIKVTVKD